MLKNENDMYSEEYIKSLPVYDSIKLLIKETSYQESMNIIRITFNNYLKDSKDSNKDSNKDLNKNLNKNKNLEKISENPKK